MYRKHLNNHFISRTPSEGAEFIRPRGSCAGVSVQGKGCWEDEEQLSWFPGDVHGFEGPGVRVTHVYQVFVRRGAPLEGRHLVPGGSTNCHHLIITEHSIRRQLHRNTQEHKGIHTTANQWSYTNTNQWSRVCPLPHDTHKQCSVPTLSPTSIQLNELY